MNREVMTVCLLRAEPRGDGFLCKERVSYRKTDHSDQFLCIRTLAVLRGLGSPFRDTFTRLFSKYGLTTVVCKASAWPHGTSGLACPFQASSQENLRQPCILFPHRMEEVKGFQAVQLEKTEKYEQENRGGFRLIYPTLNSEKYEKFFQDNNSLFQNTITSRAREEYAR